MNLKIRKNESTIENDPTKMSPETAHQFSLAKVDGFLYEIIRRKSYEKKTQHSV